MPLFERRGVIRGFAFGTVNTRRILPPLGLIMMVLAMKWIGVVVHEQRIDFGLGIAVVMCQIIGGGLVAGLAAGGLAVAAVFQWKGQSFAYVIPLYLGLTWAVAMLLHRQYRNEMLRIRFAKEERDARVVAISQSLEGERRRISGSRQRIEKILMLTRVASDLSSTLELGKVVEQTLTRSKELTGKQGKARLVLFDKQGSRTYLPTERGLAVAREEPDTMSRWVRQHSLPLHIVDAAHDERFRGAKMPEDARSTIASPLMQGKAVMGVLQVHSPAVEGFSQEDWRLLSLLADLAAVAVQNALLYQRTQEEAITDGLTGVYVHRYFRERLSEEVKRSQQTGVPLVLIMSDIDDFKSLNDTYGHLAGDAILQKIVAVLRDGVRGTDIVARYGGEEFAILLLETPMDAGKQVAERLRQAIAAQTFQDIDASRRVTISMGVACFPGDAADERALIERADGNLYVAKRDGKNRVFPA